VSSRLALAMSASALVVAVLGATPVGHAVVSALPRNSVGPVQLKRNAVGPQKLAPNAVRSGHILDGSLLAADFKAGQIPAGPKGDPGSPGVSERQIVTANGPTDSSSSKTWLAQCPAGKVVVGGGGTIAGSTTGIAIIASRPAGDSAWRLSAQEVVANAQNWFILVYAVCAKVT
jgi:hypothetical protein